MQMRNYLAVLALLVALGSGVWSTGIDVWGEVTQPDGTTFVYHAWGDEFGGNRETADGYAFVYGSDGWAYYAELDARGEYVASPYKVGIDDPAKIGIPKHLRTQRSAVRQAELDAEWILQGGYGLLLTQPDGTTFIALGFNPAESDLAEGYVISVDGTSLINYSGADPYYVFVYSVDGWYYYAELDTQGVSVPSTYELFRMMLTGNVVCSVQVRYVASSYKVGIDDPPDYGATAVQERSWGAMKHLLHK